MDDQYDGPPLRSEADIRAMLERSRRDIAEGRTVSLASVVDHIRAVAEEVRLGRAAKTESDRRRA